MPVVPSFLPSLPPTLPGVVTCIGLTITADPAWLEACRPFVIGEELAQARRYARLADSVKHLAGRALARQALRATFGQDAAAPFALTPYGKPYCPRCGAHFSISHSGEQVWLAVCREGPVGVDVEAMRPLPEMAELAARLHPREQAHILSEAADARAEAFYRCWTRKEAVLKALGRGLSLPLDSFAVDAGSGHAGWIVSLPAVPPAAVPLPPEQKATRAALSTPAQWTSCDLNAGAAYHCSVAAAAPGLAIRVLRIPAPPSGTA